MADKPSKSSTVPTQAAEPPRTPFPQTPDPRPERGGSYRIEGGMLVEAEPATAPSSIEEQR
ncbi:MAG: hypothetical protein ACOY42_02025 [Pseudomonadota bacterium]